ncbi:MAG: N-acetyltransferase [Pseudomonadota bacterium]
MWSFLNTDIIVETARVDCCAALSDVHAQSFHRGWTADELARLILDDTVIAYMATRPATLFRPASKEPRAFVLARVAADEAEILTIAVAPDARELGVGRALMQRVMDHLYADRIGHLFLEVDETNEGAVTLYRKLGFKKVGERNSYYAGRSDEGRSNTDVPGESNDQRARALVMRCDLR